jgi:hypothetical protein
MINIADTTEMDHHLRGEFRQIGRAT